MQCYLFRMTVKFTSLIVFSKSIRWVFSIKAFSSVSSVIHAHSISKPHKNVVNRGEIDPKIQFLKNGLCPDNLIKVLDNTHDLNSALKVFKWASLQKQFRQTARTYSSIILKLGFAGNVDEMEGYCREMVKDRCHGAEEALSGLVDVFVGNCRLEEAIRVFLVMNSSGYRLSMEKWNGLLGALVEGKRGFRDVLLVYKEMVKSSIVPNVDTLNYLIRALFDANMVDYALDQYRRMDKKRCVPNCRTFEIVIHGLVASNLGDEALGAMNTMFENGVEPDLRFYTNVIPLLCKENRREEAMRLFKMIKTSEFEPAFGIYSSLIKCLCVNLCLGEATELFQEMKKVGFSPSTEVLVEILNACCKLGKLDEARSLLDEKLVLDPSPYNVLLQGYCDAQYILTAKDLLRRMVHVDVADHISWNTLIRGLCSINQVKQAYQVLGKMIVFSYIPDAATYSAFVIGKCNLSKYEDALELFRRVSGRGWILDSYSYDKLVCGLCHLKKFPEVFEVFMFMSSRNCSLHSSSFNRLVKSMCVERVDEAIRLLKFGHSCKNPVDTFTYSSIMHGLLKLNRPYEGLAFLSHILRRGLFLDVEAYCILIQCMIALQETNHCVLFLNEMLSKSLIPDSETLASLLKHLANHSQLHAIWVTVSKLSQESEVTDPKIYNVLINGLCKEGYKTEAHLLLDLMLEKGWVPDASTHGWLIGSTTNQEAELRILKPDNLVLQDEVSSILSEGLEEP